VRGLNGWFGGEDRKANANTPETHLIVSNQQVVDGHVLVIMTQKLVAIKTL
jgi:hypothetical protein